MRLAQVSTYSSDLLDLLHSRPLAASVALHQNLGLGDEWKTLVGRLWAHLEPYSSYLPAGQLQLAAGNENDILSRMEDVEYPPSPVEEDFGGVLPMEGVEFVSVSGVYIDTMIRDISPDMDVCAERGTVSAAPPAPMIVPPSLPPSGGALPPCGASLHSCGAAVLSCGRPLHQQVPATVLVEFVKTVRVCTLTFGGCQPPFVFFFFFSIKDLSLGFCFLINDTFVVTSGCIRSPNVILSEKLSPHGDLVVYYCL